MVIWIYILYCLHIEMSEQWIDKLKDLTDILLNIFSIIAIIGGAIWGLFKFGLKREKYPWANIDHKISMIKLTDERLLLRVTIVVDNVGEVKLKFTKGEVRLSQILPLDPDVPSKFLAGQRLVKEGETEIIWPYADCYEPSTGYYKLEWQEGDFELEPKETDERYFDFIIAPDKRTLEVYSYLSNVYKEGKEIGWLKSSFYTINS